MGIFFTADTHFLHDKNKHGFGGIIFHTKRPFATIQEHDDTLVSNWNNMVGKKDEIYILGDFCWRNHSHYIHVLNGKKILVTGSHDKMPLDSLRLFSEVHKGMLIRTFSQTRFCLTHCAMRCWESSCYGAINLYGHSHGRLIENDHFKQMDVGMDVWGFKPVPLELILLIMSTRIRGPDTSQEKLDLRVKNLRDRNELYRKDFSKLHEKH